MRANTSGLQPSKNALDVISQTAGTSVFAVLIFWTFRLSHYLPNAKRVAAMPIVNFLRIVERTVIVAIFLSMTALYFLNVVIREVAPRMASDFVWIDALVGILNLYLVFLTAGLALERGRQVCVDAWRDRLAAFTHLPIRKIIDIAGFLLSVQFVYLGWQMCAFVIRLNQKNPTLDISTAWFYAAPTIGFGLLGIRFALSALGFYDRFSSPEEAC